MQPTFSIVVPVYNVELYLKECLLSLQNQSYKSFEVLMINDGSTDESGEIAENFVKNDSRFKLFSTENKGLSAARNLGLKHSQGKYVYFCDSDDYIARTSLKEWIEIFEKQKADLILFEASSFSSESRSLIDVDSYKRNLKNNLAVLNSSEYFSFQIEDNNYIPSACLYVTKRDALDNLRFKEGILHEDNLFYFQLLNKNLSVFIKKYSYFHRRVRENSITQGVATIKHFNGYKSTIIEIIRSFDKSSSDKRKYRLILTTLKFALLDTYKRMRVSKGMGFISSLFFIKLQFLMWFKFGSNLKKSDLYSFAPCLYKYFNK